MKIGISLVTSIVISTACVYSVRYIEIPALQSYFMTDIDNPQKKHKEIMVTDIEMLIKTTKNTKTFPEGEVNTTQEIELQGSQIVNRTITTINYDENLKPKKDDGTVYVPHQIMNQQIGSAVVTSSNIEKTAIVLTVNEVNKLPKELATVQAESGTATKKIETTTVKVATPVLVSKSITSLIVNDPIPALTSIESIHELDGLTEKERQLLNIFRAMNSVENIKSPYQKLPEDNNGIISERKVQNKIDELVVQQDTAVPESKEAENIQEQAKAKPSPGIERKSDIVEDSLILKKLPSVKLKVNKPIKPTVQPKIKNVVKATKTQKIVIKPAKPGRTKTLTKIKGTDAISSKSKGLRAAIKNSLAQKAKDRSKISLEDRKSKHKAHYVSDQDLLGIIANRANEMNNMILNQHDIIPFHQDLSCNNGACFLYVSDAFLEHEDHKAITQSVLNRIYNEVSKMPIKMWPILKAANNNGEVIGIMDLNRYKNSSNQAKFIVDQRNLKKESKEFKVPRRELTFNVQNRMKDILIGFDMHSKLNHLDKPQVIRLTKAMIKLINMQTIYTVGAKLLDTNVRYIDDLNDQEDTIILTFSKFISKKDRAVETVQPLLDFMKDAIIQGSNRTLSISGVLRK